MVFRVDDEVIADFDLEKCFNNATFSMHIRNVGSILNAQHIIYLPSVVNVGDILSHTSPVALDWFKNTEKWPYHMSDEKSMGIDDMFISWMGTFSNGQIKNVSLLDIPTLLSVTTPRVMRLHGCKWSNQPKSTFHGSQNDCTAIEFAEKYSDQWVNFLKEFDGKFPNSTCINFTNDLIGKDLELLLKIMKYSQDGDSNRYRVHSSFQIFTCVKLCYSDYFISQ
jgi:hypothetical protein